MRSTIIAVLASVAAVQAAGPAAAITNNPAGANFVATFPDNDKSTVRGSVVASSSADGKGVKFTVDFSGIPAEGGPFKYHIHDQPVPADGNCTKTLAHLDPYERGEDPPCDPTTPADCQVGDLSGKFGAIKSGDTFHAEYTDNYAALTPGIGAYFGNRSIVFHYSNKTRITCANFVSTGYNGTSSTPTPAPGPTGTGYPIPSPTYYPGAATRIAGSSAAIIIAVAAAFI